MSITVLFVSVIALLIGAVVGWLVGSARKSAEAMRALAERDMARVERERSDAARAAMQRRVEDAQQLKAVAETRAAEAERLLTQHAELRRQMEDSFAALAQKAFKDVSEGLVQSSQTQMTGVL